MIAGLAMWDKEILGIGKALEAALADAGCATHYISSEYPKEIHT
jgi:hypothetical protein